MGDAPAIIAWRMFSIDEIVIRRIKSGAGCRRTMR
jgi:hypothetical protein